MQRRGRGIEVHPVHLKATFRAFLSIHLIFKAWLQGIFCATIIGIVPGFVCSPRDKGEAVRSLNAKTSNGRKGTRTSGISEQMRTTSCDASNLNPPGLLVFDRDRPDYLSVIDIFEHSVETKAKCNAEQLPLLMRYTNGEP